MKMTIKGFAHTCGVGVETIRYYQRLGLLNLPKRTGEWGAGGRIRRYGAEDVRCLRFIRLAKAAGFTLLQIKELLDLDAGNDRARARSLAKERITVLNAKISELEKARNALYSLVRKCSTNSSGPCPIIAAFESMIDL